MTTTTTTTTTTPRTMMRQTGRCLTRAPNREREHRRRRVANARLFTTGGNVDYFIPKSLKSSSNKSFSSFRKQKRTTSVILTRETRTKKCIRMATISASLSVLLAVSGPLAFVEPSSSLSSSSRLGVAHAGLNKKREQQRVRRDDETNGS